jgi:WASH complex subunit strumpellin
MPNPKSPNHEQGTVNFMGRLLKALQNLTDPKNTVYIDHALGFFELGTGKEIITMKTLGLLYRCIGVSGLNGLDK